MYGFFFVYNEGICGTGSLENLVPLFHSIITTGSHENSAERFFLF